MRLIGVNRDYDERLFFNGAICKVAFVFGFCELLGIIGRGLTSWDRERFPICSSYHLSEKNDLAYMIRIMGKLTIDCLDDGMANISNVNNSIEVFFLNRTPCE